MKKRELVYFKIWKLVNSDNNYINKKRSAYFHDNLHLSKTHHIRTWFEFFFFFFFVLSNYFTRVSKLYSFIHSFLFDMASGNTGDDSSSSKEHMRVRKQDAFHQNKMELETMDQKVYQTEFAEDLSRTYSRSTPSGSLFSTEPEKPRLKRALKARHVSLFT